MYKLSEQPASRIISEMPDFSFLNDTYVFTVKERFNISDDFYEVGDLVAISGVNKTVISILPYDTLKKCRSHCFLSCVDREGFELEISLDDFKKRFELSDEETQKVESVTHDIKAIRKQKNLEMLGIGYDPDEDVPFLLFIEFPILIIASVCLIRKIHIWIITTIVCVTDLLFIVFAFIMIIKKYKYNALKYKYQKLYTELDEKRAKNGMYLKEL